MIRTSWPTRSITLRSPMTDPSLTHPSSISVKNVTFALLVTAIVGAIGAWTFWGQLPTTSDAVAIVSIGKYHSSSIEEPQSFIERVKSRSFAAAVSGRAGIPELATLLPAPEYGGSGAISARSLRDPNLVEIRVSLLEPDLALKAVSAAVDELIADHAAKIEPLIRNLRSDVEVLGRHASELVKSGDMKRAGGSSENEEEGKDGAADLSALALTESGLAALIEGENTMTASLLHIRRTQVVAVPTVTMSKAASPYGIIAAGALGGLLVGFLLLRCFQMFSGLANPGLG
jgi:hypothetical protein